MITDRFYTNSSIAALMLSEYNVFNLGTITLNRCEFGVRGHLRLLKCDILLDEIDAKVQQTKQLAQQTVNSHTNPTRSRPNLNTEINKELGKIKKQYNKLKEMHWTIYQSTMQSIRQTPQIGIGRSRQHGSVVCLLHDSFTIEKILVLIDRIFSSRWYNEFQINRKRITPWVY